jgi:Tfp pilus assembly protein PilF
VAIAKAPDFSWLYLDRGRMKLNSGDQKGADEDLSAAIRLEPDYFLPYVYRAGLYEQSGRDAEAMADYEKIIALNPDYWYAQESRGAAAYRLGLWDKSAESFKKAYGYARDHYEYAILAGLALLKAGKPAEAKAWAGSVAPTVDREKNNPSWLMLRLIQDQNDQTSEIEISIQAEKKLDTKAAMLFYLGEYWYARGRTELASKYLGLSREQRREDCLEYRLLLPEQKRLEAAGVHN